MYMPLFTQLFVILQLAVIVIYELKDKEEKDIGPLKSQRRLNNFKS